MGLTYEHIQKIIDNIDVTIDVNSVVILGGGKYKLMTCNTKWATFGKQLSLKEIVDVKHNEYITIKSTTTPIVGEYLLVKPFFYYGTFMEVNKELIMQKSGIKKFPFVYLHLNSSESYFNEEDSRDFEADCNIYFMSDSDKKNSLTIDYFEDVIKAMRNLISEFKKAMINYSAVAELTSLGSIEDYPVFGNITQDLGVVKQIFTDNVSGSGLNIRIPFYKDFLCSEC